jgi:LmbE family N-acetylglucosaminyl deacetylase
MRLVVVSPHLDDAVMSCAGLIGSNRGCEVVTVFAGKPRAQALTDWDRRCGFAKGDDVIAARRAEDAAACARLEATPRWLDFVDDQYDGRSASVDEIEAALDAELERVAATALAIPLGLFNRDHQRTHSAACRFVARPRLQVLAYADALYQRMDAAVSTRLTELGHAGVNVSTPSPPVQSTDDRKSRAVVCYRSQLGALQASHPQLLDVLAPERYWSLT